MLPENLEEGCVVCWIFRIWQNDTTGLLDGERHNMG